MAGQFNLSNLLSCVVDTQTVKIWGFDGDTDQETILDVYKNFDNGTSIPYYDGTVEYVWVDKKGALNITVGVEI